MGYLKIYRLSNRIYVPVINFLSLSLPISPKMRIGCFKGGASPPSLRLVHHGPPARTPTLKWQDTFAIPLKRKEIWDRYKFESCETWGNPYRRLLPISLESVLHFRLLHVPSGRTKQNPIDGYTIPFNYIYEPRTEKQGLRPATMIVRWMHPLMLTWYKVK